ncbi:MAG: hypothetical protein ROR55_24760 [Devosia sp.]
MVVKGRRVLGAALLAGAALAGVVTAPMTASAQAVLVPLTANTERQYVTTRVSDVRYDGVETTVTMDTLATSPCASRDYIFPRTEPKWLFHTGRFMVAMEEGAEIIVSFRCVDGRQHINALRFITPPAPQTLARELRQAPTERAARLRQPNLGAIPVPNNPAQPVDRTERLQRIPIPN